MKKGSDHIFLIRIRLYFFLVSIVFFFSRFEHMVEQSSLIVNILVKLKLKLRLATPNSNNAAQMKTDTFVRKDNKIVG